MASTRLRLYFSKHSWFSFTNTLTWHACFFFLLFFLFREASVPGKTAGSGRERWGNAGIRGVPEAKRCAVDTCVRLHPNLCATTWGAGDGFTSTKIHCPRVTSKHQYQCKIENDLFYIYELLIFLTLRDNCFEWSWDRFESRFLRTRGNNSYAFHVFVSYKVICQKKTVSTYSNLEKRA